MTDSLIIVESDYANRFRARIAHIVKRHGSLFEVLDLDRFHRVCKFETEYLRVEI